MIIFAANKGNDNYSVLSMMVYHTEASQVKELADLIIDEENYRPVQNVKGVPDFKMEKVFSDSGISWAEPKWNQLVVRRIGTFRERFNILEGII